MEWFRKGAEVGNGAAMTSLGSRYFHGFGGLPMDEAKGVEWYRKGAEAGNANAMFFFGEIYANCSRSLPKDEVKAVEWFRKAAEAGDGEAMSSLGRMYEAGGGGLPKDEVKAVEWFRKAAAAGSEYAKKNLARLGGGVWAETVITQPPAASPTSRYITVGSYDKTECVKDNTTGLTWEGKTTSGLRAAKNKYTYYGDKRKGDASAYVDAVNASGVCGYRNWRLPSNDELAGLLDKSVNTGVKIDANWFPNSGSCYWVAHKDNAISDWGDYFSYGSVFCGIGYRSSVLYVRLVR